MHDSERGLAKDQDSDSVGTSHRGLVMVEGCRAGCGCRPHGRNPAVASYSTGEQRSPR